MMSRILRLGAVSVVAMGIGLSLRGDSSAVYGEPRFYAGQAPSRLVHNYYPGDEFIVTYPAGTTGGQQQMTWAAIQAWNNALRGTPNSIEKYPLHFNPYNQPADPNANIIVNFVSASVVDQRCGTFGDGCSDGGFPITNIWIDAARASTLFVTHELGHSLAYSDQYYSNGSCSPADTIMDAIGCTSGITVPDKNDFMYHYEPTYQSANPSIPDTQSATWNAYTQTGTFNEIFTGSDAEWRYYWQMESDTGGMFLGSGYSDSPSQSFTNNVVGFWYSTSRFCVFGKIYNEVG